MEGLELSFASTLAVTPGQWRDRPVLVTGATGLVGAHLVATLLDLNADVVCLVRDWVPRSELVRNGGLDRACVVGGDVRDQALIERVMGEYEIATVFHLAAQTIVSIANRNPVETLDSNIRGTWSMLEAARRSPTVEAVVLASSDKAYGEKEVLPYDETMSLEGRHPYDVSKSCADLIAQAYARTYQLKVGITRCGNFYGGGDLNFNRIVPGTIRSVLRGERPVIRSDGEYVRDYIYVGDAVGAYLLLGERLTSKPDLAGEAFNFASEGRVTVRRLVERILERMQSPLTPIVRNEATHEIREQFLSSDKACRRLGWTPRFTLERGLDETIRWYRRYFEAGQ